MIFKKKYIWVFATDANGDPAVYGPFDHESEARRDSGDLENPKLFRLDTRNHGEASRRIKALLLKKTGSSKYAAQKHRHIEANSSEPRRSFFDANPEKGDIRDTI